jgi:hypothetical protein
LGYTPPTEYDTESRNMEPDTLETKPEAGQMTLIHLFLGIAFFMPTASAITEVKHAGGGVLRYLVVIPFAIVIGVLIVSIDWRLGKAIWLRSCRYSERVQIGVSVALFAFQLPWIFLGEVSGEKLAAFVVNHL